MIKYNPVDTPQGYMGLWLVSKENHKQRLGKEGEKLARKYLAGQGYKHIQSNYLTGEGEIDLIMREGRTIVFVEVKTRQSEDFVAGERLVHYAKQRHMAAAARQFIQVHKLHEYPCRFDAVIVIAAEEGKPAVRHERNIFTPRF
jgi:putative endonuclease